MHTEANVLLCLACRISCHTRIFPSILQPGLLYVQYPASGFQLNARWKNNERGGSICGYVNLLKHLIYFKRFLSCFKV